MKSLGAWEFCCCFYRAFQALRFLFIIAITGFCLSSSYPIQVVPWTCISQRVMHSLGHVRQQIQWLVCAQVIPSVTCKLSPLLIYCSYAFPLIGMNFSSEVQKHKDTIGLRKAIWQQIVVFTFHNMFKLTFKLKIRRLYIYSFQKVFYTTKKGRLVSFPGIAC